MIDQESSINDQDALDTTIYIRSKSIKIMWKQGKMWKQEVQQVDAVFFACPEYNYSMPGALKNALDWPST